VKTNKSLIISAFSVSFSFGWRQRSEGSRPKSQRQESSQNCSVPPSQVGSLRSGKNSKRVGRLKSQEDLLQ